MSGIILDIVIVAIIVLAAILGRKKGFVMTLFSLATIVIAVVLSFVLQPAVSNGLNAMGLQDKIGDKLHEPISKCCTEVLADSTVASYGKLAEEMNLPKFLADKLPDEKITADVISNSKLFDEKIGELSNHVAGLIVSVLAFLIVAVLVTVVLFCLSFALKIFSKLPVIGSIDKLGGLLLGILIGLVICFAILAGIQVIGAFTDISKITSVIEASFIGEIFYKNNLLLLLAIIL